MKMHTLFHITQITTTSADTNNKNDESAAKSTNGKSQTKKANLLNNNDNETFSFQGISSLKNIFFKKKNYFFLLFFKDFISEIINENNFKSHKLVIDDIERSIELNFREFKKQFNELEKIRIPADIFHRIAKDVFKSSFEEPNGILGARLNIRLQLDGGKIIDLGRFAYDPLTLSTFEVSIILKEDVTSVKKLLHAFKLYSNFGKFLSTHIHNTNYEFTKRKLY
jgi:hypothetical protein